MRWGSLARWLCILGLAAPTFLFTGKPVRSQGTDAALPAPGVAQPPAAPLFDETPEASENPRIPEVAALSVFGREVVEFRAPFLGSTPAERVRFAKRRLSEVLERGGPGLVTLSELPQGTMVQLDGVYLFVITPADIGSQLDQTTHTLGQRAVKVLRRVIGETREARDWTRMLWAAGYSLLATLVYGLLLGLLFALRRRLQALVLRLAQDKAAHLELGGVRLLSAQGARSLLVALLSMLLTVLVLLLSYEWATFVLSRFPITRSFGERLHGFLIQVAVGIASAIADALPDLIVAVAIFWLAHLVVGGIHRFFARVRSRAISVSWLDAETAKPTGRVLAFAIWTFAVVMAYPYLPGTDTEAFKGISVLLGLMVSLGGSSVVAHAGSGLILMYTRAFRVGEYVRIADQEGTVTEQGTFTTRLRTGLGEEIVLPNSTVLSSTIKNYSRSVQGAGFVLDTSVTIGYDTPWRQVEAMLVEAAAHTPGVLQSPAPRVFQVALCDFFVEYRLVTQAAPEQPRPRAELLSALHRNIQDTFNRYGVQIMSPHYETDPGAPKLVPEATWFVPPAAPSAVEKSAANGPDGP